MELNRRKIKAQNILLKNNIDAFNFLGEGMEGVVFSSNESVYKVLLPIENLSFDFELAYRRKSFFLNIPDNLKHLYKIELIRTPETLIVKYPFEEGEKCKNYSEEEAVSILTELWQQKIVVIDCKPENCIRVNKQIKVIDLDGKEYSDNLFLNMCTRMYLYANYYEIYDYAKFQKLKRSAINNFELPELKGLRDFVNRVYSNVIFEESRFVHPINESNINDILEEIHTTDNLEHLFFSKLREKKYLTGVYFDDVKLNTLNYLTPTNFRASFREIKSLDQKVSLLIKTCPQDVETVEENVKHIIKQLCFPNDFYEIIVSVDNKEEKFLREFNDRGSIEEITGIMDSLVSRQIIDRYIVFDSSKTKELNKKWFDIESNESHTQNNAPLAPQLYAFEHCKGDYILQLDIDALIGRKDISHPYLEEMLLEFEKNDNVISVGFNIPNKESNDYFGLSKGGFVPEVRMGLLHKERIQQLLPLPNQIDSEGKPELTWHRSLFQKQKETDKVSIRGGDHNSYYIHPQNYRKKEPNAWMTILDKVEQNFLPELQFGNFDVEGSLYDWAIPKRKEKFVVVSCFRNVNYERFLRMWYSLMSQKFQDFGIILLDDHSDNGLPFLIDSLVKDYPNKVTFIKKKNRSTRMENVYRAIHYYVSDPESTIIMLDGDDALIGNDTFSEIVAKYNAYDADVVIGRFHQTYRIQPHYRYPVDFSNPRKTGGNVWQHIKTFKKYLFDSIPLNYFKHNGNEFKLSKNKWLLTCDDFAFMVPIVEMAQQPIQLDRVNYYYERDYETRNEGRDLKEQCISEILTKEPLSKSLVQIGRKTFNPNTDKIEIDITYECNLKCLGCNRSCTQSPTSESVSLSDIQKFVEESIASKKEWELINILGGEPTLHPDFKLIIEYIHNEYIIQHSPETILQIVSNGYEEQSRLLCDEMREKYKSVRIDYGSFKTDRVIDYFSPFNDAPIDDHNYKDAEFHKGCWVTSYCGIGLNKDGYYACAVAGGIDRISKADMAITNLEDITVNKLKDQLNEFCRYCGNFKAYQENSGDFIPRVEKEPFKNVMSKSWKELYKKQNGS